MEKITLVIVTKKNGIHELKITLNKNNAYNR
jgi:hypothetical protein